jgi:integrase
MVALHPRIIEILRTRLSPIHGGYMFGNSRRFNRKAYNKAVETAGIVDSNCHDLQHCAINNMRLAGKDHFVIKEASGAKSESAFKKI